MRGQITLISGTLNITANVVIQDPGAQLLTISGNSVSRATPRAQQQPGAPGLTGKIFSSMAEISLTFSGLWGRQLLLMKKYFTPLITIGGIAILAFFALPVSSAFAQYTATDVSSTVTVGPVKNLEELASASKGPAGSAGGEVHPNRIPPLRPPMQDTGDVFDQAPLAPFAASPDPMHSFFRGFTGLTHLEQRLYAAGGNQFNKEPPDQGLAVGNGFVMEAVNTAINIYDTNGIVQLPRPVALNELFGLPLEFNRTTGEVGPFVSDPHCQFDPETQRWFVVATSILTNPTTGAFLRQSRLFLAVSQSSDPRGAYATYTFNTTGAGDVDQQGPRVGDFPLLGIDRYGVYINTQEFKILRGGVIDGFIGGAILAVSKAALINGDGGPAPRRVQRFALPFQTGFEFRIWPAYIPPGQTPVLTNGGTEYFLSSNTLGNNGHEIAVWALTNTSSLNTPTPNVRLKMTVVDTRAYHFPNFGVPQKDGFHPLGASLGEPVEKLDAGNDTISSCEYVNGHIWGTLSSSMNDSTGGKIEVVDYFVFTPQITNGNLTASLFTQGVIAGSGVFLMYPAIALNTDGNGAIVFSLSSPHNFPSSAFVSVTGTTISPIHISREGNEPEDGFTGYPEFGGAGIARWGDYSAAAVNNVDNTIWMATEYIPDLARMPLANWATYITRWQP